MPWREILAFLLGLRKGEFFTGKSGMAKMAKEMLFTAEEASHTDFGPITQPNARKQDDFSEHAFDIDAISLAKELGLLYTTKLIFRRRSQAA